ncbi:MAG: dihydroorotase [Euryarchaeota archaeon]
MSSTVIRNARVFCRNQVALNDVLIESGKITKIGSVRAGGQEIDARGRLLLPGAIDVHVHFRDLDEAYKEDWYTGSCAAAAGGVTTVIDQPNTKPPVYDVKSYFRKQRAARKSVVDYGINAAIDRHDQLDDLWRLGVTSFGEVFVQEKSREELQHALQTIKRLNAVLCVHAEKRVGEISSEVAGIATVFECNKEIGAKVHVSHLSEASTLDLVSGSDKDVTCEVTPHHLFLSDLDQATLGSFGIMNPPLRSRQNVDALWSRLSHIDMVASDHAPHSIADKKMSNPPPGVPGVQTLLPLLLSRLDQIGLGRLVNLVSVAPATRFNLKNKGAISKGYDADLILVDPKNKKIITPSVLHSKCGWTPFEGCVAVFPSLTMVRGEVVFSEGVIMSKKGWGTQICGAGSRQLS